MWVVAWLPTLLFGCGFDEPLSTYPDPRAQAPGLREGPGLWTADTNVLRKEPPLWWQNADPVYPWAEDAMLASACQQDHRGFWNRMRPCIWNQGDCEAHDLWNQVQYGCRYPSPHRVRDAVRRLDAKPPLAGSFEISLVAALGRSEELDQALSLGHSSALGFSSHWANEMGFQRVPDPWVVDMAMELVSRPGSGSLSAAKVLARADTPAANDLLVEGWDLREDMQSRVDWAYSVRFSSDPRILARFEELCSGDLGSEEICKSVLHPIENAANLLASQEQTPSDLLDRWEVSGGSVVDQMKSCLDDGNLPVGHRHRCLRVLVGMGYSPGDVVQAGSDPHLNAILKQWTEHGSSTGIAEELVEHGMLSASDIEPIDSRYPPIHYADWMSQKMGLTRDWERVYAASSLTKLVVSHPETRKLQVIPFVQSDTVNPDPRFSCPCMQELLGFLDGRRYRSVVWEDTHRHMELAYGSLLNRVAEDLDLDERVWMDASDQFFWGNRAWLLAERESGRLAGRAVGYQARGIVDTGGQ